MLAPALSKAGDDAGTLLIFSDAHPVSFFFRDSENFAATRKLGYEDWSARYSRLSGVMGKMLDEEVVGRSKAQDYYRRFKAENPRQAVLLHANGTFRSPKADNRAYHGGHWLYYNGTRVLDAMPAADKTLTLKVGDASLFIKGPYAVNREVAEDVGICALAPDGKPDWSRAEHAMLLDVDANAGTITVRRGLYGSTPHAFAAGTAYVAAHVAQTWGTVNKLWQFNMATTCPRDANGRTAAEVWADELVAAMHKGGEIEFVDGVEFDVPFRRPINLGRDRKPDCDADGQPDNGMIDGVPVFALGVDLFFQRLRAGLPDKLIMADTGDKEQRSVATLNGIETEGWPHLRDPDFKMWSTALNDHCYWEAFARPPVFTYGLMKYRGFENNAVSFSTVRLTLAGPILADAAVPMGYLPPSGSNGVWDELLGGTLSRRGWLGRALGPAHWLALETPDLLACSDTAKAAQSAATTEFPCRIGGLRLAHESDVVVVIEASAQPLAHFPADSYRTLSVAIVPAGTQPSPKVEYPASPVAKERFTGRYYFRNVPAGNNDIVLVAEGAAPMRIHSIKAHAAPDLAVREFERGVILANPSHQAREFDLARLFPGKTLRRLKATPAQDAKTNNGAVENSTVTLPPKDALFLLKN
jgi:hypothetical protein